MELLPIYASEFVAVVSHCIEKELGQAATWQTKYAIPQKTIIALLERNAYEKPIKKLTIWRDLRWIDAEKNRTTRKVCKGQERQRMVCVDLVAYEALVELTKK